MKIVNSIMPMSDVEVLAANGQKLRVAVTKTSAQGKAAQSATPNLMCFSTDENSVWFNGKKYGVYILKDMKIFLVKAKLVLFSLSWESSLTMYGVVPKRMEILSLLRITLL